jgi:catechol 2,3-dioxygenase-like lactoylglutathione lyase family enzyme
MITGVQDIYYNVQDMGRAVQFYTQILGMKLIDSDEWWSSLECNGVRIGLHATGGDPVPLIPRDSHGSLAGATLTLRSNDIESEHEKLKGLNINILGFHKEHWGAIIVFEDTEGNVLKIMQPPSP